MKTLVWIIVALISIAGGLARAGEPAAPEATRAILLPPEKMDLKKGAGLERVQANCLVCHSLEYIPMQPGFTKAQWTASITKMIKVFGARISEADARIIADYLAKNYGPRG